MKQFPTGSADSSANLAENLSSTSACSGEPVLALRGHTNTLFLFIHVTDVFSSLLRGHCDRHAAL